MKSTLLLFVLWVCLLHDSPGQNVVTSPPPAQLVFIPSPYAWSLLKHPTLPALYLGCYIAPESKNLITFRLNSDGTLIPGSRKACDNYFTVTATNNTYNYRIHRPSVLVERNILYVMAAADNLAGYCSNPNNNEIVALALDEQGQPTKVLKAFRTNYTGAERLYSIRCDSNSRRLYLHYWNYFGWYGLDADGLPLLDRCNAVTYAPSCLSGIYVAEWDRHYVTYAGLRIITLSSNGLGVDCVQHTEIGFADPVCIEASPKFRKLYNLDLPRGPRLIVFKLTREGRLTSVPRYVSLPGAVGFRCDFTSNKLYAWTKETLWNTYMLDAEGLPVGEPQVSMLGCGEIRDVFVDEKTGKVYVACTQPPTPAK